jgi:hypothetical protein
MEILKIKKFLENLDQDKIIFDPHFYKRSRERPIDEGIVRNYLFRLSKLERVEKGKKDRFKLWFKMSRKYSLILIVEILISKDLKVISAWNSDKKWQKKLRQ